MSNKKLIVIGIGALLLGAVIYRMVYVVRNLQDANAYEMLHSFFRKVEKTVGENMKLEIQLPNHNQSEDARNTLFSVQETVERRLKGIGIDINGSEMDLNDGSITFFLEGVSDVQRIYRLLKEEGSIEFYETYELVELASAITGTFEKAEEVFKRLPLSAEKKEPVVESEFFKDTTGLGPAPAVVKEEEPEKPKSNPLAVIFQPNLDMRGGFYDGPILGYCFEEDTVKMGWYMRQPEIKAVYPPNVKLLWGTPIKSGKKNVFPLYAIKAMPNTKAPIGAEEVTEAIASYDKEGHPQVDLSMNAYGAAKWEKMTDAAANANVGGVMKNKCIAIVVGVTVLSAPVVRVKIMGGRSQITGVANRQEAEELAAIIASGPLKVPVTVTRLSKAN